jgi:hypothetical protein
LPARAQYARDLVHLQPFCNLKSRPAFMIPYQGIGAVFQQKPNREVKPACCG